MKVSDASFVRLVYPFLFDSETFAERADAFDGRELNELGAVWRPDQFTAADLLPHVAAYVVAAGRVKTGALFWRMEQGVLDSPRGAAASAEWQLVRRDFEIPFQLSDFKVLLFPVGVGFLSFRLRPLTTDWGAWQNFLHYARFLDRNDVAVRSRRRVAAGAVASVAPGLLAPRSGDGQWRLADLVSAVLGGASPWWKEVFLPKQAIPYAVLFLSGVAEEDRAKTLYEVHNFFHAGQGESPAPEQLSTSAAPYLPYARSQWLLCTLDGGAFVAFDALDTEFFRSTLPEHLDDQYFLLFLLALHQRYALISFLQQICVNWNPTAVGQKSPFEEGREKIFARLRDALLAFTARGYFVQVMQRRHHDLCYRKWQEVLQIERLYTDVSRAVCDLHERLLTAKAARLNSLAEATRGLQVRLSMLAGLFLPLTFTLSLLGTVKGPNGYTVSDVLTGLGPALVVSAVLMTFLWARSRVRAE